MTTVVAVVGTIAGAGTTTVVTALGAALGEQRQRVALVDATEEGSRIDDALELEADGDLADALRRGTTVSDVQATGPHDLAAFPAAPETSWGSMRPDAVATLYDRLRERFEFVLVDCGSSLSPARIAWLGHADEAVIVTDPDVAGAVPETGALAGAFDVPVRGVLANRVPPKEVGDAIDVLAGTDHPVLGVLPEDPTVGVAADAGASVLRTEPDSAIATCAWELASRFRKTDHDDPVVPQGTGPPASADDAGAPDGDDTADGDGAAHADDGDADNGREADAGETGTAPSPEPAPAADAESVPSPESDSPTDAASSTPSEPAESPTSPGGSGPSAPPRRETGESTARSDDQDVSDDPGERRSPSNDEDPFTQPEPQAVEEADDSDGEDVDDTDEDAADAGEAEDDESGATTDDADENDDGAAESEALDGLLGDVRAHIGAEQRPEEATTERGEQEGPADRTASDADPVDDGVGDDATGSSGGSSASPRDDGAPDRDASGSEDDAVLGDDDIESLFEDTMDRVAERRDREGTEEAEEAKERED